jgi:nucleoside-diphosphate-sugar epimerase
MRIFITGATGYIGRVVTEHALAAGHQVHGLSRNAGGDARLRTLGATPVRGELTSRDVLLRESGQADAVVHLAYIHDWGMDYEQILRIDAAAVGALGEPLQGTDKALVVASGTAVVEPDPGGGETAEDAPLSATFVLKDRIRSERNALRLSEKGVRVSVVRLPPYVYGRGGSGFVPMLLQAAANAGESLYVDEGGLRTSDVHVDDAAELFLLAARLAAAGDVFNGTASTTVTLRELAAAIGDVLQVPLRSVSRTEAEAQWGPFLTAFVQFENRASNRKAVQQLGWQPKQPEMLTDIRDGSYRELAASLRQT